MEYDRREPIKGVSGWESTAVTKLSVHQLLAREGAFEALTQRLGLVPPKEVHAEAAAAAAEQAQENPLRQPPHMRGPVNVALPEMNETIVASDEGFGIAEEQAQDSAEPDGAEAPAPRSFLRRIFGS
ncbi:MAG: hypothetical protein AAFP13_12195 [Pseudomonadota bacterium]